MILISVKGSTKSIIKRAFDKKNNQSVVLKILNKQYPTHVELLKFKCEFELLNLLKNEGVIEVYRLIEINNSPAIIMEDIHGQSLESILNSGNINFDDFLPLAIKISGILANIHKHNIIHKDINPSNFIWNKEKNILRIIDFGISTELPREITSIKNLNILEGTLPYISPEQTGRMNRSIEYRTDFYSLGITFYQLLTGKVPFETNDVLELIRNQNYLH